MSDTTTAPRSKNQALAWLVEHSPVTVASYRELADVFGWERDRTWKVVQGWRRKGYLETETSPSDGKLTVSIIPTAVPITLYDDVSDDDGDDVSNTVREVSERSAPAVSESVPPAVPSGNEAATPAVQTVYAHYVDAPHAPAPSLDIADAWRVASLPERLLLFIALGLSATAAYASVCGLLVLFPLQPVWIITFGSLAEAAKFAGVSVLASGWRAYSFLSKSVVTILMLVTGAINAAGVYGTLIENHVNIAAHGQAAFTSTDADAGAKLELAAGKVADLDKRIQVIDAAAEAAAKRAKNAKAAKAAIDVGKTQREPLVKERDAAAASVAGLKSSRAAGAAKHEADVEASTPIRYASMLFEDLHIVEPGTDPERLLRWLAGLVLLTGDPLALALVWMIGSRAKRRAA